TPGRSSHSSGLRGQGCPGTVVRRSVSSASKMKSLYLPRISASNIPELRRAGTSLGQEQRAVPARQGTESEAIILGCTQDLVSQRGVSQTKGQICGGIMREPLSNSAISGEGFVSMHQSPSGNPIELELERGSGKVPGD